MLLENGETTCEQMINITDACKINFQFISGARYGKPFEIENGNADVNQIANGPYFNSLEFSRGRLVRQYRNLNACFSNKIS